MDPLLATSCPVHSNAVVCQGQAHVHCTSSVVVCIVVIAFWDYQSLAHNGCEIYVH